MKKRIAVILLAAAVLIQLPEFHSQAAGSFTPPDPSYNESNGVDGKNVIPFYGYIGEDTNIVDPDPTDPEVKPETQIYVEVPVKVAFAAFKSDGGTITSPEYQISNLSTNNAVKVEVENFVQTDPSDLEGKLSLNLLTLEGSDLLDGLFPASYPPAKVLKDTLAKKSEGSTDNTIDFKIGGNWSGGFNKQIEPAFDMTLKFTVAP